jgi:inorganic phosphate transporter, PiT family
MTAILILVCFAALFLAYTNGANDNFKGVATLYGSGMVSYRTALTWATISTSAGAISSVFLAASLVKSFSGKGLVPNSIASAADFHLAVAIGAGLTVLLATWRGFPISTTHGMTGALLGAGLVATGGRVNFTALGQSFILPLLLSPAIAIGLAMVLYSIAHRLNLKNQADLCACVGEAATFLPVSDRGGTIGNSTFPKLTIDTVENCQQLYPGNFWGIKIQKLVEIGHFASAGIVSFARGLNDTPKIVALIILMPSISIQGVAIAVGMAMAIGGWLNARRVAEKMSKQITTMNAGQGLVGNVITGVLVIAASLFGLPVSTTHVAVGSIFGVGLISRQANHRIFVQILLSWLLTLPISALLGGAIYAVPALRLLS